MKEEKEVMVEECIKGMWVECGPAAGSHCGVCKKSKLKSSSSTDVVKETCPISFHQDLMWLVHMVELIMFSFCI